MEVWEEIEANPEKGSQRLIDEYGNRLYAAASMLCPDLAAAEDLVFRTLAQAVRKIAQYRGRAPFFSWLYRIMFNFWRMDMRRKGANALVFDGEVPEMEDAAPDPCEALAVKADAEAIRNAVDNLSEPLRTVVTLHYFEDFSLLEIAGILSLPLGTVKFRLHRARKELAAALAQTFLGETASN